MKKIKNATKRLNLTFDDEFYKFLETKATENYIRVGTWVQQYLQQSLKNNFMNKSDKP